MYHSNTAGSAPSNIIVWSPSLMMRATTTAAELGRVLADCGDGGCVQGANGDPKRVEHADLELSTASLLELRRFAPSTNFASSCTSVMTRVPFGVNVVLAHRLIKLLAEVNS